MLGNQGPRGFEGLLTSLETSETPKIQVYLLLDFYFFERSVNHIFRIMILCSILVA
jgi:hypothetical protein